MTACWHITVKGKVQGVAYRANAQKQAVKLGIRGYVRNQANGDVEIVACAGEAELNQMVVWCRQGPLLAKVTEVVVNHTSLQSFDDFQNFNIE